MVEPSSGVSSDPRPARRLRSLPTAAFVVVALLATAPGTAHGAPHSHPDPPAPHTPSAVAARQLSFYDTAGVTAGTPGSILRHQPVQVAATPGLPLPRSATRLLYSSRDVHGTPVPVSGVLAEPVVPWGGPGPRPTVVIGRGTNGQGDHCAPSRGYPYDGLPDPLVTNRKVAYEYLVAEAFLAQGIRVLTTDYIGLGTPGMHTYMLREEQAHAMLDGARAALALARAGEADPVAFWGHSQGGGAAAAAAESAAGYAPELVVAGTWASAPPADLDAVQRFIDGSSLTGAVGYTINALRARYPEIERIVQEHLNDAGREALADIATLCTTELTDKYGGHTTAEWTRDGRRLDAIVRESPAAQHVMDRQRIGGLRPNAPVMVIAGRHDDVIDYGQIVQLSRDWCAQGAQVVFRDDVLPPLADYNHFAQAGSGGVVGLEFLLGRFHGSPLPDICRA